MRSWISLGVLLAAVFGLGLWVYLKPDAREASTYAVSTLKAAQVKRVKFERLPAANTSDAGSRPAGPPPIVLDRQDAGWRMTAPFPARADAFHVARLLSLLDARAAVRYPATELARFGLDRPVAKLDIDGEAFAFGGLNKTTREQYVQKEDVVYVLPLAPGASLPRDAETLIARELFSAAETPVRFELPGFNVTLVDGAWRVEPALNEASADERAAWVDAWRQASAIRVTPHAGPVPRGVITVTLKNGATLPFDIVSREPALVLLRIDERLQYHFAAGIGKRLLSPPGAPKQ